MSDGGVWLDGPGSPPGFGGGTGPPGDVGAPSWLGGVMTAAMKRRTEFRDTSTNGTRAGVAQPRRPRVPTPMSTARPPRVTVSAAPAPSEQARDGAERALFTHRIGAP